MYWKNPPWKKCTFIMHRNGEIKQSHIARLWNSLYSWVCSTWRVCLVWRIGLNCLDGSMIWHTMDMDGWVKICKISHQHWRKHNDLTATVSRFYNVSEGLGINPYLGEHVLLCEQKVIKENIHFVILFTSGGLCVLVRSITFCFIFE